MHEFPRSAYIHIPFCHRRCFYCDFAVIPVGDKVQSLEGSGSEMIKNYLHFLFKEILSIKYKAPLSTIYIGGGTPSILDPKQIGELISLFRNEYGVDYGAEITMEVDPASFNKESLDGFMDAGVNRFSLGAQSFNDQILKIAGRRHTLSDVQDSCELLREAQFQGLIKSWSLDLIQDFPKSNKKTWKNDLYKAISYSPPHISIYDLSIEDGTVFNRLQNLGKLSFPDSDESYENSLLKSKIMKKSGYKRYEISNYSIAGHQSRHNRVYWRGLGWWAFGQGSTSSPFGLKFTRPRVSKEYKKWVDQQYELKLEDSLLKTNNKTIDLDERIMLGMRLKEGVNFKRLFFEYGWKSEKSEKNLKKLLKILDKYKLTGLLLNQGERYFLSDPIGMDLSNQILIDMFKWSELIKD